MKIQLLWVISPAIGGLSGIYVNMTDCDIAVLILLNIQRLLWSDMGGYLTSFAPMPGIDCCGTKQQVDKYWCDGNNKIQQLYEIVF